MPRPHACLSGHVGTAGAAHACASCVCLCTCVSPDTLKLKENSRAHRVRLTGTCVAPLVPGTIPPWSMRAKGPLQRGEVFVFFLFCLFFVHVCTCSTTPHACNACTCAASHSPCRVPAGWEGPTVAWGQVRGTIVSTREAGEVLPHLRGHGHPGHAASLRRRCSPEVGPCAPTQLHTIPYATRHTHRIAKVERQGHSIAQHTALHQMNTWPARNPSRSSTLQRW